MAQSAGVSPLSFSPAGQSLLGASPGLLPDESEEERKKRLAGLQASRSTIERSLGGAGSLSSAGTALLGTGSIY